MEITIDGKLLTPAQYAAIEPIIKRNLNKPWTKKLFSDFLHKNNVEVSRQTRSYKKAQATFQVEVREVLNKREDHAK